MIWQSTIQLIVIAVQYLRMLINGSLDREPKLLMFYDTIYPFATVAGISG